MNISCTRSTNNNETAAYEIEKKARPSAILHTGENPLWFLLTQDGPVHIELIENAVKAAAFEPWPLAVHVRFFYERDDAVVMAVNRLGFLKIAPSKNNLELFFFSGGDFWKRYTVGGFVNYNGHDTALLYLDDWFKESDAPLPHPRTWSFNMESNSIFAHNIPALENYPSYDGWDANALRQGSDNFWYYRVIKKTGTPDILYLRTENLSQAGIAVNTDDFFNSAPKKEEIDDSSLPVLPKGFVYTGISRAGNSIIAYWEEQHDYLIGAAGFMLIKVK